MSKMRPEDVDPRLKSVFLGGPLDGRRSADFPPQLAERGLYGVVVRMPLSEPHWFSLFAVYRCSSKTMIDGWWHFEFDHFEGPKGEQLVAAVAADDDAVGDDVLSRLEDRAQSSEKERS